MKTKIEIERKFLLSNIPNLEYDMKIDIYQFYVGEYRFRLSRQGGVDIYEKFKKTFIGKNKYSIEEVELISEKEYYKNKGLSSSEIWKERYIYSFKGKTFEIDTFKQFSLTICEVELSNFFETFYFPLEIEKLILKEVTNERKFSNQYLATLL